MWPSRGWNAIRAGKRQYTGKSLTVLTSTLSIKGQHFFFFVRPVLLLSNSYGIARLRLRPVLDTCSSACRKPLEKPVFIMQNGLDDLRLTLQASPPKEAEIG